MILSINQPAYLPWLGYFHRIAISDLHVVLDHVQFEKNSFTNRNRVCTAQGSTWLTVPVRTKGRFGNLPISRLEIAADGRWAGKHWATLSQAYARAPHFQEHAEFFRDTFDRRWHLLADLMTHLTSYLLDALRVETRCVRSSELDVRAAKSDLILDVCRTLNATHYLSGPVGRDYLDLNKFEEQGIGVVFHDYRHPTYPQCEPGFQPFMAAVDLLFNCGSDGSDILRQGQEASCRR